MRKQQALEKGDVVSLEASFQRSIIVETQISTLTCLNVSPWKNSFVLFFFQQSQTLTSNTILQTRVLSETGALLINMIWVKILITSKCCIKIN